MDEFKTDVKNYSDVDSEYQWEEDRNTVDKFMMYIDKEGDDSDGVDSDDSAKSYS